MCARTRDSVMAAGAVSAREAEGEPEDDGEDDDVLRAHAESVPAIHNTQESRTHLMNGTSAVITARF
jgi:hypothetical protein